MECGCFRCLTVFSTSEVIDWIDDGNTPLCPYCGSDALAEDVTDPRELLRLHERRFGTEDFGTSPWDSSNR